MTVVWRRKLITWTPPPDKMPLVIAPTTAFAAPLAWVNLTQLKKATPSTRDNAHGMIRQGVYAWADDGFTYYTMSVFAAQTVYTPSEGLYVRLWSRTAGQVILSGGATVIPGGPGRDVTVTGPLGLTLLPPNDEQWELQYATANIGTSHWRLYGVTVEVARRTI